MERHRVRHPVGHLEAARIEDEPVRGAVEPHREAGLGELPCVPGFGQGDLGGARRQVALGQDGSDLSKRDEDGEDDDVARTAEVRQLVDNDRRGAPRTCAAK